MSTTLSSGVFWRSKLGETFSEVEELYHDTEVYRYYSEEITSGTSGVLTPPANVTIIPDSSPNGEGCLVAVENSDGSLSIAISATGVFVRGTIEASGNWALTDGGGTPLVPAAYPVFLIYQGKSTLPNTLDNLAFTKLLDVIGSEINVEPSTASGQILFGDGSGGYDKTETNELSWDDTNKRLGVGIAVPEEDLHVNGTAITITDKNLPGNRLLLEADPLTGPQISSHTDSSGKSTAPYVASRWQINAWGQLFQTSAATAAGSPRTWTSRLIIQPDGDIGIGGSIAGGTAVDSALNGAYLVIDDSSGYISIGKGGITSVPARRLEIQDTATQLRWAYSASIYGELQVDPSGITTITTTGNAFKLGSTDNVKAYWGASNDLEIYHDGTDSVIKNNTGKLKFDTSDVIFATSGSGLPYGQIYEEAGSSTLAFPAQDTWYQLTNFSYNGSSNLITPDYTNAHQTVLVAGVYLVIISIDFYQADAVSIEYDFHVKTNNGTTDFPQTSAHQDTNGVTVTVNAIGVGIISLSANDTVEVWGERLSGGGTSRTITVVKASLTLLHIGG